MEVRADSYFTKNNAPLPPGYHDSFVAAPPESKREKLREPAAAAVGFIDRDLKQRMFLAPQLMSQAVVEGGEVGHYFSCSDDDQALSCVEVRGSIFDIFPLIKPRADCSEGEVGRGFALGVGTLREGMVSQKLRDMLDPVLTVELAICLVGFDANQQVDDNP